MENNSELIIYTTEDGVTKVDVTFVDDTVWLTQEQMSELFQKAKSTINEHINNIYEDGELKKKRATLSANNRLPDKNPISFVIK